MVNTQIFTDAGLTEGESKVYAALLELGSSTTGPILKASGVANSVVYRILDSLTEKGLVSHIVREKTRVYTAAEPARLLDFLAEQRAQITKREKAVQAALPSILSQLSLGNSDGVQMFQGFRGFQTAWEMQYQKLKKGEEYHAWAAHPVQEERYHRYWKKDHIRRSKTGIKAKLLFNKGTDPSILKNRNSFKGCEARYMPSQMVTKAWFMTYKDVTGIFLQESNPLAVIIVNQDIADSFNSYFEEAWESSKKFPKRVLR